MTHDELKHCLEAAIEAARRGGAELERFRGKFRVSEKARADLVTDADIAAQTVLKEYLFTQCPNFLFIGEEEASGKSDEECRPDRDSPPAWVVDPLDGTTNYVHDVPAYCVSIGLYHEGKSIVGAIFDPRLNEMFSAAVGTGAFLNGERMRVSSVELLRDSLLATGFAYDHDKHLRNLESWKRFSGVTQGLRRTGSTALNMAYVAAGRHDGYWCNDNRPWDMTAAAIMITEAGGTITRADGSSFDPFRPDVLATNGKIQTQMLEILGPR